MNTNERPQGDKFSFYTTAQLYLELQAATKRIRQLEQRLLRAEEEIKGLCAVAEFSENIDDVICNLISRVEALSSQVATLSQPMSSTTSYEARHV